MVNYPTATYILEANKIALAMTKDKHPHKLLIQIEGIQRTWCSRVSDKNI
jgi:hypothetical protein